MEALKHIGLYCKLSLYFLKRFCTDRENCTVKVGLWGAIKTQMVLKLYSNYIVQLSFTL